MAPGPPRMKEPEQSVIGEELAWLVMVQARASWDIRSVVDSRSRISVAKRRRLEVRKWK